MGLMSAPTDGQQRHQPAGVQRPASPSFISAFSSSSCAGPCTGTRGGGAANDCNMHGQHFIILFHFSGLDGAVFYEVAIARRPDQSIRSKITTFHFGSNPIFGMRTTRRDTKWTRRDAIFIFSFSFWRAPIAARPGDCAVVDGNAATAQKQTPETL